MEQYKALVKDIIEHGQVRRDRTGVGTVGVFGRMLNFDLEEGFPILTLKHVPFRSVAAELSGFLRGFTSADQFRRAGCKVWDANANDPGTEKSPNTWLHNPSREGTDDLGRIYGVQWRKWQAEPNVVSDGDDYHFPEFDGYNTIDQIEDLIRGLINNPYSRRHLVTAWNPTDLDKCALPPCHYAFQCYIRDHDDGHRRLDLIVHMRSVDVFLGLPFNIASYAALTHWIAHMMKVYGKLSSEDQVIPGRLTMTLGDTHLYLNHMGAVEVMMSRESKWHEPGRSIRYVLDNAKDGYFDTPRLSIDPELDSIERTMAGSFILIGYEPHPKIAAPMAV